MAFWGIFHKLVRRVRTSYQRLRSTKTHLSCALGDTHMHSGIALNGHFQRYMLPCLWQTPLPANDRTAAPQGRHRARTPAYCLNVDMDELTFIPILTAEQETIHFLISPFEQEALHLSLTAPEAAKVGRHIVIDGTEIVNMTFQDRGWTKRYAHHTSLNGIKPIPGYCVYQHISGAILQVDDTINVQAQDGALEVHPKNME